MVTLSPIEQADFERFLESEIREYAQDEVKSGNWLAEEAHRRAFICDFVIEPQFRGQGFGKQALRALDKKI